MQVASRTGPLVLTAVKSHIGHAETGSGVLGMFRAWSQLSFNMVHSITHLQAMNAYVASSLERCTFLAHAPRQNSSETAGRGILHSQCISISSFAFQVSLERSHVGATGSAKSITLIYSWLRL